MTYQWMHVKSYYFNYSGVLIKGKMEVKILLTLPLEIL